MREDFKKTFEKNCLLSCVRLSELCELSEEKFNQLTYVTDSNDNYRRSVFSNLLFLRMQWLMTIMWLRYDFYSRNSEKWISGVKIEKKDKVQSLSIQKRSKWLWGKCRKERTHRRLKETRRNIVESVVAVLNRLELIKKYFVLPLTRGSSMAIMYSRTSLVGRVDTFYVA